MLKRLLPEVKVIAAAARQEAAPDALSFSATAYSARFDHPSARTEVILSFNRRADGLTGELDTAIQANTIVRDRVTSSF